jgi:hypothetical protein
MRNLPSPSLSLLALLLVAACWLPASAQAPTQGEETSAGVETPPTSDLDRVRALTMPGEHHERLAAIVGTWGADFKVWLAPEAEPVVTAGQVESRWILGKRFVETTYQTDFMGQSFAGKGVEGYDSQAKEYVGTWRDNQGTLTLVLTGQCEEDCRIRTMEGRFTEPVSGQQLTQRTVTTVIDDDSYTFESFLVAPDGETFKNLELSARRNKK